MFAADHPIWSILRLVVLLVSMFGVLYINASNFDRTEIVSIVQLFIMAVGIEGGAKGLKAVLGNTK